MASFLTSLWESIFTPGPTPTLLVATNATFAALQAVLAAMLYATHSVHFVVLSVLCGGLWAAINWFARELKAHQRREAEEETLRAKEGEAGGKQKDKGGEEGESRRRKRRSPRRALGKSSGEESETEVEAGGAPAPPGLRRGPSSGAKGGADAAGPVPVPAVAVAEAVSTESEVVPEPAGELRLRVGGGATGAEEEEEAVARGSASSQGHRSAVSTEDEWEKVSENEQDR